jgi:hypothetical protein
MSETIGDPFFYKNRIIYPVYRDDGSIIITYKASKTEAERIASKYGEQFVGTDSQDTSKYYVTIGTYAKNSSNFGVFTPGEDENILDGISNKNLSLAIKQDKNFYNTANKSPSNPSPPSNTPVDPNQQNTQGGESSTPTNPPATPPKTEKAFLVYPLDMADTKQDRIKFTAVKYLPSGDLKNLQITPQNRKSQVKRITIEKPVFLPIQASITDQNSADWQGGNLNYIDQKLINLSGDVMNAQSYDKLTEGVSRSLSKAFEDIRNESNEIKVALAEQAVGVTGLLGRFGSVLNPNFELLFTGPQLRPFEFQFKMSAREAKEAAEIKEIIKFFKQNMAAIKDDTGIFLRAPNTFFIEYMYGGRTELHPGINKIKECALLNCAVDYTPNGTYMTYQDGTMVSYTLSLSFQELEPIYSGDYKDEHSIGY